MVIVVVINSTLASIALPHSSMMLSLLREINFLKQFLSFWNQPTSVYLSSLETGIVMGTGFFVTMLVKPLLWHRGRYPQSVKQILVHKGCVVFSSSSTIRRFRWPLTGDPNSSLKYPPSGVATSFHRWHPRHLPRQHPFWNGLMIHSTNINTKGSQKQT